jgi:gamma-glutamylcyclotransferase (GGCT)/AIG2-like uncharacterized protein YtfP
MLYFAYGSMMDFGEMQRRCRSASFVAIAKLPDHSLQFTRLSNNRGCGVADAVPKPGGEVWGVVYELAQSDLTSLDGAEGFKEGRPLAMNSYIRHRRLVHRNGDPNDPLEIWTYLANRQENPPKPNAAYKSLIVNGANHWGLPEAYQNQLARIEIE